MMPLARCTILCATLLTGLLTLTPPAHAGDGGGPQGLFDREWSVGGMLLVTPRYEGAKDYRVIGFPMIFPSGLGTGDGLVQFRGPDDLRLRLLNMHGFEAGPLIGWRFGREEDDGDRLRGLGDVDGGFVAGAYAAVTLGMFKPFLSYHHQVTGDDGGGLVRFGVEAKVPVARDVQVRATLGSSIADKDYMAAYFSVTPAQSLASLAGLPVYDAGAGIKDVFVGFSADLPINSDWTLKLNGRYTHLVGDAADSPIVESESQFSGGIGLTYRFGTKR